MLAWTGVAGAWVSDFEPGAALIAEALELAERLGDKRLVGYASLSRSLHLFAFSLHREMLEPGQDGIRLLRAEGDEWDSATLLAFMELAALGTGRTVLAAELGDEVERLGARLGHFFILAVLHGVALSARRLAAGPDLDELEAFGRRHLEVAGPMGFHHHSCSLLSHAAFLRGDVDEALRWADEGIRAAPEHHHTSGPEVACSLRALAYLGRATDLVAMLGSGQIDLPQPGRPNGWGRWYPVMAAIEALAVIGHRDAAASSYGLIAEFIATSGLVMNSFPPYDLPQRIAGIGAAAGGQWDAAEEHFLTALRQAGELPHEIEGAETRRWYARMLLDRGGAGDRDRAGALLDEAIAVYRRVGMPRHEELARALIPR
jgi:hypothetical protein